MTNTTMPKLIDGRAVAEKVYGHLRSDIAELKARGVTPGLAVILVGDNPASRAYVRSKDKMCRELGLHRYAQVLQRGGAGLVALQLAACFNLAE